MIVRIPVAVYEAAATVDDVDTLPDSDPAPLARAIREALDLDRSAPGYGSYLDMTAAACERLRALSRDIGGEAMVMSSSHRFNDACGDDYWLTVSIGSYRYSNGTYFGSAPGPDHPHHEQGQSARALLDGLVAEHWAGRLAPLARLPYLREHGAREIGLLVREDGDFLMIGDSVTGGRGIFWSIDPEAGFALAGVQADEEWEIDELADAGRPFEIATVEHFAAELLVAIQPSAHRPGDSWKPTPPPGWPAAPYAAQVLGMLRDGDVEAARSKLTREAGMTEAAAVNWIATVQDQMRKENELGEIFDDLTRLDS